MSPHKQPENNRELENSLRQLKNLHAQNTSWVAFTISSNKHTAKQIGEILNLDSSTVMEKGDLLSSGRKQNYYAKIASWTKSSKGTNCENSPLQVQIDWLFSNHLYDKREEIRSLIDQGCSIYLTCYLRPWTRNFHSEIHVEQLRKLTQFGIALRIDYLYQNTHLEY